MGVAMGLCLCLGNLPSPRAVLARVYGRADVAHTVEATMSEWKPIETAPRDGTEVDLWCPNYVSARYGDGARMADCWWERDRWVRFSNIFALDEEPYADIHGATHWMPLPEPPK
jgi:hypothetical protein